MAGYSKHQLSIINRYYEHRETLMLQKLGELTTDLVLAETDAKRAKLWERVAAAMKNLNVAPRIAEHILARKDPEILAKNLNEWLAGKLPRGKPTAKKPPQGPGGRR